MTRILYLAHDLADPAVGRRVAMLRAGGASVDVAGFVRRLAGAPADAIVLGRTRDGRMAQRAGAVLWGLARVRARLAALPRPDAIMARNVEMLALAHRVSGGVPVAYECLDVHRLLLRRDGVGAAMRALERRLANRSALLVTSSPAFAREHFHPSGIVTPVCLVENKVFDGAPPPAARAGGHSGPLRIGWFGALRCRRSLDALTGLAARGQGRVELVLRGRPARGVLDDLPERVAVAPGIRFDGPYRYPDDLADLYGAVDLVWAIDFYEAGGNSDWLLPNRLYEGGRHGVVPIALEGTETARWLARHDLGVRLPDIGPETLDRRLGDLARSDVDAMGAAVAAADPALWTASPADGAALVERLAGLGTERRPTPRPGTLAEARA